MKRRLKTALKVFCSSSSNICCFICTKMGYFLWYGKECMKKCYPQLKKEDLKSDRATHLTKRSQLVPSYIVEAELLSLGKISATVVSANPISLINCKAILDIVILVVLIYFMVLMRVK